MRERAGKKKKDGRRQSVQQKETRREMSATPLIRLLNRMNKTDGLRQSMQQVNG